MLPSDLVTKVTCETRFGNAGYVVIASMIAGEDVSASLGVVVASANPVEGVAGGLRVGLSSLTAIDRRYQRNHVRSRTFTESPHSTQRGHFAGGLSVSFVPGFASSLSSTGAERWSLLISLAPFPGSSGSTLIPVAIGPEVHLK